MTHRPASPWPSNEFFEQRGYGPDGVKRPDPNLHVVDGELSYVDQLRSLGIYIDPGDELVLANPKAYGPFGDATLNDYEIRRTQRLETPDPASIILDARQQSA